MSISELTPVRGQNYTFNRVFEIYDAQFEMLRDYILTLGDIIITETFTGSTSKVITTSSTFNSGSIVVYKNDDILWSGEDYTTDASNNKITLSANRSANDKIRVLILQSNFLQTSISEYLSVLESQIGKSEEVYNKAVTLMSMFTEMSLRLDQKIADYNREKNAIEDIMTDLAPKMTRILKASEEIHDLKVATQAYYQKTFDISESVEGISGLTPQEIVDNEIVIARAGADSLGIRLNAFLYTFGDSDDMRACLYLKNRNMCQFIDSDGGVVVCRVTDDIDDIGTGILYFRLVNGLFAYKVASNYDVMNDMIEENFNILSERITNNYNSLTGSIEDLSSNMNQKYDSLDDKVDSHRSDFMDLKQVVDDVVSGVNNKVEWDSITSQGSSDESTSTMEWDRITS